MKTIKSGFTLIELLVVIAIIGVLASVVLVSLNSARAKGKDARIQEEMTHIRSLLNIGYLNNTYNDLTAGGSHVDTLTVGSSNNANITLAATDMGIQSGWAGGTVGGITVYSNDTTSNPRDWGIYAKTNSGYFCMDSFGNIKTNTTSGAVPAWAGITSPTTMLCQ